MRNVIDKAFYVLKGFCEKQMTCEECRFNNDDRCAMSLSIPANWKMPKKDGENDGR